ncbi:TPA_asm: hypothetical protein 2 [Formosus virus]|nr:TPA_asm: hypothetical protein 2 [Formosus virus]
MPQSKKGSRPSSGKKDSSKKGSKRSGSKKRHSSKDRSRTRLADLRLSSSSELQRPGLLRMVPSQISELDLLGDFSAYSRTQNLHLDSDEKPIALPQLRTISTMSTIADEFYNAYFSEGPITFDGTRYNRIKWARDQMVGESASLTEIEAESLAEIEPQIEIVTPATVESGTKEEIFRQEQPSQSESEETFVDALAEVTSREPTLNPEMFAKISSLLEGLPIESLYFRKVWNSCQRVLAKCKRLELYIGKYPTGSDPGSVPDVLIGDDPIRNLIILLSNGLAVEDAILSYRHYDRISKIDREVQRSSKRLEHLTVKNDMTEEEESDDSQEPRAGPSKSTQDPQLAEETTCAPRKTPEPKKDHKGGPKGRQLKYRTYWVAFKRQSSSRTKGSVISSKCYKIGPLQEEKAKNLLQSASISGAVRGIVDFKRFSVYKVEELH